MKKGIVLLSILLLGTSVMGYCQINNEPFKEVTLNNENDVIIYFYRVPNILGAANSFVYRIDNKIVGALKKNSYVFIHAIPGAHLITYNTMFACRAYFKSGNTYIVRQEGAKIELFNMNEQKLITSFNDFIFYKLNKKFQVLTGNFLYEDEFESLKKAKAIAPYSEIVNIKLDKIKGLQHDTISHQLYLIGYEPNIADTLENMYHFDYKSNIQYNGFIKEESIGESKSQFIMNELKTMTYNNGFKNGKLPFMSRFIGDVYY